MKRCLIVLTTLCLLAVLVLPTFAVSAEEELQWGEVYINADDLFEGSVLQKLQDFACGQLDAYVADLNVTENYREAQQAVIAEAVQTGKTAIGEVTMVEDNIEKTKAAINVVYGQAIEAIDAVKTDAQLTAEAYKAGAKATVNSASAITVTCTANEAVTAYEFKNVTSGKVMTVKLAKAQFTGLKAATAYKFQVRVKVQKGTCEAYSAWSTALSVKTAPAKVTGVAYKATSKTAITLSWSKVAGAAGYQIYNVGTKKAVATTTKLTYQIGKLKAGTTYNYQVRAYVTNGSTKVYGAYSTKLATTTLPAAPAAKLTTTSKKVTAKWGKVTGATSYQVQLATNKAISKGVKKATVTGVSKAFTGLKKGTTYYVRVRTAKKLGTKTVYSAWSAVKSIKCK